jgi:ATP-binding cassette subfamily B protein
LVISILFLAIAGYFRSFYVNNIGEKVITDLRKDIYNHIIRVSPEFFEVSKVGDVISRLTVDTTLLYSIISNNIAFALRNFLLFFGGIVFLFITSPKLTLVSLLVIVGAVLPIIFLGKKIKLLSKQVQENMSLIGSHIEETISGIKTIQAYLCEDKEVKNFNSYLADYLKSTTRKNKVRSLLIALVIALAFSGVALVLWVGGSDLLQGKMSGGELSSFIFYSVLTATSLVSISQITGQLQNASAAAGRLFEILKIKSPISQAEFPEELVLASGYEIEFKNVNFSYPSRPDTIILKDFNLKTSGKEKLAIVGESGSGKSTILQLLMRFYDVNSGEILINGQNIKNLNLKDLRGIFAYISQDCFIFSGTVYDNIAYVNKDLTKNDVQKIIDGNEALHFINNFPKGIDSFIGEKGVQLSGGERQRIAIARAIAKNSSIFLLDEITSALDDENSDFVSKSIAKLTVDKAVITVTHKASIAVNCDRTISLVK